MTESTQNAIAALEARLAAIESHVAHQNNYDGVLDTLLQYSRAIDTGRDELWLDCFVADAVFEVRSDLEGYSRSHVPGVTSRRLVGQRELRAFITAHTRPPEAYHRHVYVMPAITIERSTAAADGYLIHLIGRDGRPTIQSFGHYVDRLVKCDDSRWRIVERIAHIQASIVARP